jgi:predicted transcriptional regulator YheO
MEGIIQKSIDSYIPIADFIADIGGKDCEVVLHDVHNLENSIVYIRNNHVSGRIKGGPLTDLGLKLLKEKAYAKKDFVTNYPSSTKDGKILRSSTFYLKDDEGELIGMLCVNMDVTRAKSMKDYLEEYVGGREDEQGTDDTEHLSTSIEDLVQDTIKETISDAGIPPERMTPEEKMERVQTLNSKGIFMIKGAVTQVADILSVSENTVYRYLNKN